MRWIWCFFLLILGACTPFHYPESALPLDFYEITGSWASLRELDQEFYSPLDEYFSGEIDRYQRQELNALSDTTIKEALEGSDFSFETSWNKWLLYRKDQLIATGDNLFYFLTDKTHIILCSKRDAYPCFIDDAWKAVETTSALPKLFKKKVYYLTTDPNTMTHQLFENDRLLYSFSADHPTGEPLLSLEVNEGGRWISYIALNLEQEKLEFHLVHNRKNLIASEGRTDAFELRQLKGKLFYFYQKDGKIYYSLAGKSYGTPFQEVIHDGCCSAGVFSLRFLGDSFLLYGKKNGRFYWYQVKFSL